MNVLAYIIDCAFFGTELHASTHCLDIHGDKSPHKMRRISLESVQTWLQMSYTRLLLISKCGHLAQRFRTPNSSCKMFRTLSDMPMASAISYTVTCLSSNTILCNSFFSSFWCGCGFWWSFMWVTFE